MTNYWNKNEDQPLSEREAMEESLQDFQEEHRYSQADTAEYQEEPIDEVFVDESETEEEYDQSFLKDARLRLEMGRLYDMLLSHDLFAEVDADSRAVNQIQKEIRKFIRERMEIMLGLRQPESKANLTVDVSLPFNDLEIQILKSLAATASKGETTKISPSVVSAAPVRQSIKPLSPTKPFSAPKPVVKPIVSKQSQAREQLTQNRDNRKVVENKSTASEPLNKPVSKMSAKELMQRNKEIAARQQASKAAEPTKKLRMPSTDEMAAKYLTSQSRMSNTIGSMVAATGRTVSPIETISDSDLY